MFLSRKHKKALIKRDLIISKPTYKDLVEKYECSNTLIRKIIIEIEEEAIENAVNAKIQIDLEKYFNFGRCDLQLQILAKSTPIKDTGTPFLYVYYSKYGLFDLGEAFKIIKKYR